MGTQEPLFPTRTDHVDTHGYRAPLAAKAAGITYRQLDYWARTGLAEPSLRAATGSGSQRLYSYRDVVVLRVINRLLTAGITLRSVRTAVQWISDADMDLAAVTVVSDGASVYAVTSPDEVLDVLAGGQAVFALALGRITHDTAVILADAETDPAVTVLRAVPDTQEGPVTTVAS